MSTALIRREDSNLALAEVMTLGDVFKASGYFKDVRDQAQAVVKILYGRELGFSPVVSMMGIHIIEGKPALSSNLMGAMVKRSGKYNYRVKALTDKECTLDFFEDGKPVGDSLFSMDDAQRAGVVRGGSGWTKYPRNMLFARALSNGVKLFCPELSACPMYVPEELGADVDEEGQVRHVPQPAKSENKEPITFRKPQESQPETRSPEHAERVASASTTDDESHKHEPATPMETEGVRGDSGPEPRTPESASTVNYITVGQQKNFHMECRKAVSERRKMEADTLTYQWLVDNHYVNGEGQPSAALIKAEDWPTPRNQAVAWLRVQ